MDSSANIFVNKILTAAAKRKATTIHLSVNSYPAFRIDDSLVELRDEPIITDSLIKSLAEEWLEAEQKEKLAQDRTVVFTKEVAKKFRLKISFFFQKGFLSANLRLIPERSPLLINLGLPKSVYGLVDKTSGLIVVAGPYGSGRTTTIASMIEEINKSRAENIVTIEKPIEYIFTNQQSIVEQREVGKDTLSFTSALRSAQQADVDVVAVEANQEPEVIPLILEFANSGRLAFLNMDTTSAVQTIEEIFAAFKGEEKQRGQLLLSESLLAVIVQRLVPRAGGGLVLATEVLIATEAVRSLISQGRIKQLDTILQSSRAEGMSSLDQSLAELVRSGQVLIDKAIEYAIDPESFRAMAKA
ncbi:MAG: Flp pilus assembly complex ATPase component TadA [Candidatus Buchananbacteria bacterium]|nr:Flp pilus assembly complex ATPase component TadA [Candidatus Buchananbacteria bacterium]